MRPTLPPDIHAKSVRQLQDKIGSNTDVILVPVLPEPGEAINDCHRIVLKKVASAGGQMISGWLIWEVPSRFIEAVFHSVWRSPEGELRDVTRHEDGESQIAFIPDPRVEWQGEPVRSHRLPLTSDRKVHRSIDICEAVEELQIQTFRENNGPSQIKVEKIFRIHVRFTQRNDECFCGSHLKYKQCCKRRNFDEAMQRWLYVTSLPGRMCEAERRLKG